LDDFIIISNESNEKLFNFIKKNMNQNSDFTSIMEVLSGQKPIARKFDIHNDPNVFSFRNSRVNRKKNG
jgi:hypothetical protein